jgi:hypothetical protein
VLIILINIINIINYINNHHGPNIISIQTLDEKFKSVGRCITNLSKTEPCPKVRSLPVRSLPVRRFPVKRLPVRSLPVRRFPVKRLPVRRLPVKRLPVWLRFKRIVTMRPKPTY